MSAELAFAWTILAVEVNSVNVTAARDSIVVGVLGFIEPLAG